MLPPSKLSKDDRLLVEFPLCTIQTSIFELSERLQIPLDSWDEPGMGDAHGFGCRLASGAIVVLVELDHARKHFGSGPTVYVEASQLIEYGIEVTLNETIASLLLSRESVTWLQTEEGRQAAEEVVQAAIERMAKRKDGA
ncbi:hypothetical protein [Xanthomonas bundabergensis]|uniref:hypothetical protein n=1 Tax=Xanthomonas bundabergensis TaxID=3160842 RepID=UPI0035169D06